MKLMLLRQSGRPSDLEKTKQYDQDWKKYYDLVETKAQKVFEKTTGKLTRTPQMIIVQRMLRYVERQLTLKYGAEDWKEIPKSARAWEKLLSSYEDVPILVARRADKGLVLILMDQMQG